MNIICGTLNSKYIHSTLAPWCLKAGIEAFCNTQHSVSIVENSINNSLTSFCEKIIDSAPDIIAFSCYIWNINMILKASEIIKEQLNCIVCLGGPEVEYRSNSILNDYPFIDYIISGEGEWSFSSLINTLENNNNLTDTEGVSFRDKDYIVSTTPKIHKETPPSPYCQEYLNVLNGRISYIEASRGCPYRCSYCLSGRLSGYRNFDYKTVTENIVILASSGTQTIKFIDRTFNANERFAIKILQFIRDNYGKSIRSGVCFHFEISADIISEKLLSVIKTLPVGICQFEIGIQSFNKETLKAINRNCNLSRLENNIKLLSENNNVHIHIDLIAGLPHENLNSFISSFNKAFLLKAHMLQCGFLKILYGADICNETNKYNFNYKQTPPYEIISNDFISAEELTEIKYCERATDKLYNSGRFILTLEYLLSSLDLEPFEILRRIGKSIYKDNISLSEIVENIYSNFCDTCDQDVLKEKIRCDIISCGANIKLPDIISSYDKRYKVIKKTLTEKFKENVKLVILNSENKVFIIRQQSDTDLRGRFIPIIYEINEII